jgi:hypothetical protein
MATSAAFPEARPALRAAAGTTLTRMIICFPCTRAIRVATNPAYHVTLEITQTRLVDRFARLALQATTAHLLQALGARSASQDTIQNPGPPRAQHVLRALTQTQAVPPGAKHALPGLFPQAQQQARAVSRVLPARTQTRQGRHAAGTARHPALWAQRTSRFSAPPQRTGRAWLAGSHRAAWGGLPTSLGARPRDSLTAFRAHPTATTTCIFIHSTNAPRVDRTDAGARLEHTLRRRAHLHRTGLSRAALPPSSVGGAGAATIDSM